MDPISLGLIIFGCKKLIDWIASDAIYEPNPDPKSLHFQPKANLLDILPGHKLVMSKEDAKVIGDRVFKKHRRILEDAGVGYYELIIDFFNPKQKNEKRSY